MLVRRLTLRKVSKTFRSIIDSLSKPVCNHIGIYLRPNCLELDLEDCWIYFQTLNDNQTRVGYNGKQMTMDGYPWTIMIDHLKYFITSMKCRVKHITFSFTDSVTHKNFIDCFKRTFHFELCFQSVLIKSVHQLQVLPILTMLKFENLLKLEVNCLRKEDEDDVKASVQMMEKSCPRKVIVRLDVSDTWITPIPNF